MQSENDRVEREALKMVLTGTTLRYLCESFNAKLEVHYSLTSNCVRVVHEAEDLSFTSEWVQMVWYVGAPPIMDKIREALEQWLVLSSKPSIGPGTRLRTIYEVSLVWEVLEHLLAEE